MSPATRLTKLKVYNDALWRLAEKVLPLMERRLPIYRLTPEALPEGSRMAAELLTHDASAERAKRTVSRFPTNTAEL